MILFVAWRQADWRFKFGGLRDFVALFVGHKARLTAMALAIVAVSLYALSILWSNPTEKNIEKNILMLIASAILAVAISTIYAVFIHHPPQQSQTSRLYKF